MPPRRKLGEADRGRALAWIQEGVPLREIGTRLGVTHSVIQRLRTRFLTTGLTTEAPRSGRPRITTRRQDRMVVLNARRHPFINSTQLRADLRAAANLNVSNQTIRNRLHEANIHSRRPAVGPILTQAHRRARTAWCRTHQHWTRQQWSQVLFTDESRFTVSFSDGRARVWRRQGERFIDGAVQERDRFGGGSVMVWGGFSHHHRTPLQRIHGYLTGQRYRDDILQPVCVPTLQAIGQNAILQDDNARPHRARVVTEYLQQQQIRTLPWPAYSPDLAPIEHLWDELGRRVRNNNPLPNTVDELWQLLQQEWMAIPQRTLQTLVHSMRQRCIECLAANGGHTRY